MLGSAVANATEKGAKVRELVIESVLVGPGPTQKRFRPGSRGRSDKQLHRTCHITVVVSDEVTQPKVDKVESPKSVKPQTTKAQEETK